MVYRSISDIIARSSVVEKSGCWEWSLYIDPNGYGRARIGNRIISAHRVAYELAYGPIPDSMTVDHLCFNTQCVNPSHLRILTLLENQQNQRCATWLSCESGHPLTEENTYIRPGTHGRGRQCRACNREAVRRYKEKKRAAA